MDFTKAIETFLGSYIAAAAILVVGGGILIWKIATRIKGMDDKIKGIGDLPCADHSSKLDKLTAIETKVDSFPCHLHSEKIDRHHDQLGMTNELLKSLEGKMDMLVKLMPQRLNLNEQRFSNDVPSFSQKNSPRVLNDNGKLVSKIFGCEKFLETNSEWLMAEVAKFEPKTALDVEIFSYSALRVASLDERFNGIKNQIYNSPAIDLKGTDGQNIKSEVALDDLLFIMSLPLRDKYLAGHPEITAE
ncbi:hypothetical protein [uncultured Muribaculum sp.]|uniref:hypothetical protein n=1 Tax=uncultured Muribaculum sp. TaxID=1918613 RepID=UPI0025B17F47|nr:hypothetical protein [uncultured Muribaculum sp.]